MLFLVEAFLLSRWYR